ncbi:lipoprotein [Listeria fleischmannii FSL S10-1203]|uniref:Lipoprotein n=2 Tax=Listeria fleischmannii TaxID=1069827 RepID=W7DE99_9LIST|nr:lipoprotein [Listeria fleischmannii FSL S10-1203]
MGNSDEKEKKADDGTTPVAEYEGQGFIFVDGDKSKDIVEKNEAEIKKRAIAYMKDTYKTNVKVNNVVPARDAAVVMVEAEEPIEFHTSVIVGLDMQKKELDPAGSVHSQEGEVESAIVSGLYAKAYEAEFKRLDTISSELANEYNFEGIKQIAIDKTHASGYEQKYYFVSISSLDFPKVYQAYIENTNITSVALQNLFMEVENAGEKIDIPLTYFNNKKGLPEQDIVDTMGEELKKISGLPTGTYTIEVYKNFIVNRVGLPNGDSTDTAEIQK